MTLLQKFVVSRTILSSSAFAEPMRVMGIDSAHTSLGWQIVNDTIMGGRSESGFVTENGQLQFSGVLNTNGGGFASLRQTNLRKLRPQIVIDFHSMQLCHVSHINGID
jgi:hypothetical protein